MTFIQCAPIIISLIAISLSVYTYFKHDRKIKKLSLDKLEKEDELEKKAIINAKYEKSKGVVKVLNRGKATAKNVRVLFCNEPNIHISNNPSPIDIKPDTFIEIRIRAFSGSPSTTEVAFEWEDDFKLDNKDTQTIQLR